jgi:hypothetical protein
MMADLTYTEGDAECALCVWEEMLRLRNTEDADNAKAMTATWEWSGTAEMRVMAIDIGKWIVSLFEPATSENGYSVGAMQELCDQHSFDWDVIPAILTLVVWDKETGWEKPPGTPAEIAARVAEALKPKETAS